MRKILLLILVALTPAAVAAEHCIAQQAEGTRPRVPAWVAIDPELKGTETRFRLARFAGSTPRDVILLQPDADATTLTQAVEALLAARRAGGDTPSSDALLRVRQPHHGARVLPWAGRVLYDVRAAATRQIPGVGRVRAVQIWLPAQQRGE
jgi:hypothetical protein